jgi:hypothetical protein
MILLSMEGGGARQQMRTEIVQSLAVVVLLGLISASGCYLSVDLTSDGGPSCHPSHDDVYPLVGGDLNGVDLLVVVDNSKV